MLQNAPDYINLFHMKSYCLLFQTIRKRDPKTFPANIQKKIFGEACPQTPLANAWLRHASQAPPPPKKIVGPPLANPAYAHELLLRNLFENPPWQTVDCV